jgi:hypothetical protein
VITSATTRDEPGEKFEDVHLVDDFTPSGTTFIRQVDGRWKGKLKKFNDIVSKRAANSALISQLPTNTLFTSTITFLAIRRGRSWRSAHHRGQRLGGEVLRHI